MNTGGGLSLVFTLPLALSTLFGGLLPYFFLLFSVPVPRSSQNLLFRQDGGTQKKAEA